MLVHKSWYWTFKRAQWALKALLFVSSHQFFDHLFYPIAIPLNFLLHQNKGRIKEKVFVELLLSLPLISFFVVGVKAQGWRNAQSAQDQSKALSFSEWSGWDCIQRVRWCQIASRFLLIVISRLSLSQCCFLQMLSSLACLLDPT